MHRIQLRETAATAVDLAAVDGGVRQKLAATRIRCKNPRLLTGSLSCPMGWKCMKQDFSNDRTTAPPAIK
jgi:hypothetical protein